MLGPAASCCWRCARWSRRSRPRNGWSAVLDAGCWLIGCMTGARAGSEMCVPAAGGAVTLIWVKRVWHCLEPACAVATWTERSEAIRPRLAR
jgi:hypothetical protein